MFKSTQIKYKKKNQLYILTANLYTFQKGVTYSGIKIFNRVPSKIYIYTHIYFTDPFSALASGKRGCILAINFVNILLLIHFIQLLTYSKN